MEQFVRVPIWIRMPWVYPWSSKVLEWIIFMNIVRLSKCAARLHPMVIWEEGEAGSRILKKFKIDFFSSVTSFSTHFVKRQPYMLIKNPWWYVDCILVTKTKKKFWYEHKKYFPSKTYNISFPKSTWGEGEGLRRPIVWKIKTDLFKYTIVFCTVPFLHMT